MADNETRSEAEPAARRRHWPAVTAVAAAVAVLASALYTGGLLTDDGAAGGAGAESARQTADGGAPAAGEEGAAADHAEGTGVFYRFTGEAPQADRNGPVYEFAGEVDRAAVAELAEALSVPGTPELGDDGFWWVGADRPEGELALSVSAEEPGEWMLTPYRLEEYDIAEPEPGTEPGIVPDSGPGMPPIDEPGAGGGEPERKPVDEPDLPVAPLPEESVIEEDGTRAPDAPDTDRGVDDAPQPHADPVSEKAALAAVAPLLDRLGLSDAAVDASASWGDSRGVEVTTELDGLPLRGWVTQFYVGPDGSVTGGDGVLLEPVRAGEQPLIDAEEALTLLNGGATEPPEDTMVVELTRAELGLGMDHTADGPRLVPSWFFAAEEEAVAADGAFGHSVSHPAVEPGPGSRTAPEEDPTGKAPGGEEPGGEDGTETHRPEAPEEGATGGGEAGEVPEAGVLPYDAEDTTLTYQFWAGVCGSYTVVAEETAKTVTLRVEHTMPDEETACIMLAEMQDAEVTLDAPVGGRTLLDEQGEKIEVVSPAAR